MTFTEKLDMLMEANHLNKNTLSKACGIPYTTIDGWYKKGVSDLKLSTLRKLTAYFGQSLSFWLDNEEESEETKKSPAPEDAEEEVSYEEMKEVLVALGFITPDHKLSEQDVGVLLGVIKILSAHFGG